MYLLDTDILTLAHAGHSRIAEQIQQHGETNVATTVITAIEILRGRQDFLFKASDGRQLLRAQELLSSSEDLLRAIHLVIVDDDAAAEFDKLRQNKKLRKIGHGDLLIASIALGQKAILVTRNVRDFGIVPGLQFENSAD
jgi:tRNA(fMet)-specific endonuclease VapC